MQIIKKDLKHGEITVKITEQEDLWHLSHVICESDIIRGKTERKIRIGNEENAKVVRKQVFLVLETEKVEYEPENNSLRVLGKIREGPEDVPIGSYHSFNLEENAIITITKQKWAKYEIERLEEAEKPKLLSLLVIFDRENAILANLTGKGYKKITELKGDVQKKADESKNSNDFYKEICEKIEEHDKREKINNIIIASPAFWKDYLLIKMNENLRKKTISATISDVSESAINELMKRPELKKLMNENRAAQELIEIDELLNGIREDKAFYGLDDSREKILMGAAEKIIVSETFLKKMKEKNEYKQVDELLMTAEDMNAKIVILSNDDSCKKMDSLGGIGGISRWSV